MFRAETILSVVVGFLALAGIGGSVFFMTTGGANPGFAEFWIAHTRGLKTTAAA